MNINCTILAATIAVVLSGNAFATKKVKGNVNQQFHPSLQNQIVTFEESSVPEFVKLDGEGTIAVTKERFINGDQSLVWQWEPNTTLEIDKEWKYYTDKEAYNAVGGRGSNTTFSVWIYNEKPSEGELHFQFGNASQSNFSMKMDFTGWRSVGMAFSRDMQGIPAATMQGLKITPKGMSEGGKMYVDRVMVGIDDSRYQWSDDLVTTAHSLPEIDYGLPDTLPKATAEEIKGTEIVKKNLVDFHLGDEIKGKKLDEVFAEVASYNLSKKDGVINGVHILTSKQMTSYHPKHLSEADKERFDEYVDMRKFSETMERVARAYHQTQDAQVKQELKDAFILMSEHALDQGFQDGASLVALHHWGYTSRGWYASLLLMEDVLKEAGLFQATFDSLLWSAREFKERGFDMRVGPKSSDMDYWNTLARAHLIMLVLEVDPDKRVALLKKYGQFASGNLAQTPAGYADGFRPDGTAWRHRGNYPGYSFAAMDGAAHVSYMLHGTPFALTQEARDYLKLALLSARLYSNPNPSVSVIGRRPFFKTSIKKVSDGMFWLAMSNGATVDTELAAAYLRALDLTAEDGKEIFGIDVAPEAHPQGNYTFNYAAMGVHRWGDNMVTMKGWNRYVWSSEIYHNANRYGRYQSHGTVQVQKWGEDHTWGYDEKGWNWNRVPSATTINLPWKYLDAARQHTTMMQNNLRFNGATNLDNKYGAFGFQLEVPEMFARNFPQHYDGSFTFKKSAFAFDDRIVIVGSDISNSRDQYETETTLFQLGITEKSDSLNVNGEQITAFPYKATLQEGEWLIDGMGTGYYVLDGGEIEVRRQEQESRDNQQRKPTKGNFQSAWIKHGKAPSGAEYEYLMVLDATPEKMAAIAESMKDSDTKPYEVIKKDSNVHVVKDKATGVTGYTAFKYARVGDEFIRSISSSSVVMTQMQGETLKLSVANPDLNMEKDTLSKEVPTSVTLNGKWEYNGSDERVSLKNKGSRTTVTFICKDGLPIQVNLKKA